MRRWVRSAALITLLFLALITSSRLNLMAAVPQSVSDKAAFQVFLTALAKNESAAPLQETDLSVSVDKVPAQVKALRSAKNDPLLFAVLVDISMSGASTAESIKQAAVQLFQRLAVGQNQGYLVLFNQKVAVSRAPLAPPEARKALDDTKFVGATAVYDAITQTCRQKLNRSGNADKSRRLILLISDGEDNQSRVTREETEEAALEEGVSVFAILTKSSLGGPRGENFIKEVSQKTGGVATNKDLAQAVPLLLDAVDAQWAVTVTPTQVADGKLHTLQLKCTQRDVKLSSPIKLRLQ